MDRTQIWAKYEKGRDYHNKKAIVTRTDRNWSFFNGDQWKGLESGGEQLPVFNFIKPIIKYKVATVAQNNMTAVYSDMEDRKDYVEVCKLLGRKFISNWEKAKMDSNTWRIIRAAAIQGDSYLYFGTNDVADVQILHNTQIMLGNENEMRIQKQPYIIITQRMLVSEVKELAKKNGVPQKELDLISANTETTNEIGNKEEVDDKCTLLLYFDRDENGYIRTCKATEYVEIEKMHSLVSYNSDRAVVGGLKSYPIVSMVWEELPNNARGNSEVEQLIPNQIEVNKTLVRRSMSVKMSAFPRIAYDSSAIDDPTQLETVGSAIGLVGGASGIDNLIKYLNPASMSHDAETLLAELLSVTRELAGAGDAAMGNIDPEKASGAAITAVRDQASLPLNEQVAAYKQFVEDLALLWYDMEVAYLDETGMLVSYTDETGEVQQQIISREALIELKPNIRIDVSSDNGWTKYAEQQELANHLNAGHLTFEEYIDALPDGSPLPKNKIKALLERRKENAGEDLQMQEMPGGISGLVGV